MTGTSSQSEAAKEMTGRGNGAGRPIGRYLVGAIIVIAALAVVSAGCFVLSRRMGWIRSESGPNPTMSEAQLQGLVDRVGSLIVVKSDEKPTIATIQDADLLRGQNPEFYKDAENGDRLLVWSDKAVLYSTSEDKILAVLPIHIEQPPQAATSTAEAPVIEVRNGSKTVGLAKAVSERLKAEGFNVGSVATASKTYPNTRIVTANGESFPTAVAKLEQLVGGKASGPVSGEAPTNADILVIVGMDYGQ